MTMTAMETHNWVAGLQYLNRVEDIPGNVTTIFLKPEPACGPDQESILVGLRRFGFNLTKVGTKLFDAIELRVMWRNLRDWEAWIQNSETYHGCECPVYRVVYAYGGTLSALDFYKKETRRRFGVANDQVRNFFHSPDTLFESLLHTKILLDNHKLPLPRLTCDQLRNIRQLALLSTTSCPVQPDFFLVTSLLRDEPTLKLSGRPKGLSALSLSTDGSIAHVMYFRRGVWVEAEARALIPASKLFRILFDSTFLSGSKSRFVECLSYYENGFLQDTLEAQQESLTVVDRRVDKKERTADLWASALLPDVVGRSKVNALDLETARDLMSLRSVDDSSTSYSFHHSG